MKNILVYICTLYGSKNVKNLQISRLLQIWLEFKYLLVFYIQPFFDYNFLINEATQYIYVVINIYTRII